MKKIHIGLKPSEKRAEIQKALNEYKDVDRIFVFYGDKEHPEFEFEGLETIYTPWSETEMYRTFYPLLGQPYKGQDTPAITDKSLLVVDEMLVDRHRGCLKQNCTLHFMRVSSRRLIFNWMPFIDQPDDFMILVDYAYPDRYKRQPFQKELLEEIDCRITRRLPEISSQNIETSAADFKRYEKQRDKLFDDLGQKDPNTIPRKLILLAGSIKKKEMKDGLTYVARNSRIKGAITYKDTGSEEIYIIDPTYKRKELIDFIRRSSTRELIYLQTDLPVDKVYLDDLNSWYDRMEDFYEKADLCK